MISRLKIPHKLIGGATADRAERRQPIQGAIRNGKTNRESPQKVPARDFGGPAKGAYPMPAKAHAANAKARATQMVKKGKLSESEKKKIDAKANKKLRKATK